MKNIKRKSEGDLDHQSQLMSRLTLDNKGLGQESILVCAVVAVMDEASVETDWNAGASGVTLSNSVVGDAVARG